jgi:sortase A
MIPDALNSPPLLRRIAVMAICAVLALSSCSAPGNDATASAELPETTIAPAPTSTAPTSTAPTTAAPTTTTVAPTTTLFPPPPEQPNRPIDPPLDVRTPELEILLGSIEIPRLGVDSVLYQGIREYTLDKGPGHWPGAALPGQPGNSVVVGHRTSYGRVFRDIDQLEPGDEILYHTFDGTHTYRVTRTEIVTPDALWVVDPTEEGTTTLIACHPPGSTRERIIVFADLVTDPTSA